MGLAPITAGKDFNQYNTLTINSSSFPYEADIAVLFRHIQGFNLFLQSGGPIYYSFNGNTIHGQLIASTSRQFLQFDNRVIPGVWFKVANGGTNGVIHFEAWGICR